MKKLFLWAPEDFYLLSKKEREQYRCGPGNGILEKLVPDTWRIGWPLVPVLRISPSCQIHDFCYSTGPDTAEWKRVSDRGFRNNLLRQVQFAAEFYSRWYYPITRLRLKKAQAGYIAVKLFGGPAFWNGRNKASEEQEWIKQEMEKNI